MGIALWLSPRANSSLYESLSSLILSLHTLFDKAPVFEPHITITSSLSVKSDEDIVIILNSALAAINSINEISSKKQQEQSTESFGDETLVPEEFIKFTNLYFSKKYFQKVNFTVEPNSTLVSFARIIRELFVEVPRYKELYQKQQTKSTIDTKPKRARSLTRRVVSNNSVTSNSNESINSSDPPVHTAIINHEEIPLMARRAAEGWSIDEFRPHLSLAYSNMYTINSALERTIKTRVEDLLNIIIDEDNRIIDDNFNLTWPKEGTLQLVECVGPVEDWKVLGSINYHL